MDRQGKSPRVSIVLPTFNRQRLLARAIDSVRAQSLANWELIIINDASTDHTQSFLEKYAEVDPRIYAVHNRSNRYPEISRALNQGLAIARAPLIARLDDDDFWPDPGKLETQCAFLDQNPDYVIAGGAATYIDADGNELARKFQDARDDAVIRARALLANPFNHSAVMFRREAALAVGGYSNLQNAEDWELWLKMGQLGKYASIAGCRVCCTTADRKTTRFRRAQAREALYVIQRHRRSYPKYLLAILLHLTFYGYATLPDGFQEPVGRVLSLVKRWVVPE